MQYVFDKILIRRCRSGTGYRIPKVAVLVWADNGCPASTLQGKFYGTAQILSQAQIL